MRIIDATLGSVLSAHLAAATSRDVNDRMTAAARDLGLAALLGIAEHRERIEAPQRIAKQVEASLQALRRTTPSTWPPSWQRAESLAMRLAQAILLGDEDTLASSDTFELIGNPHSSLREDAMEITWFCRPFVPREVVMPMLLSNIAGTPGWVHDSFSLAHALCGSTEAFLEAADEFEPDEPFGKQFETRIARVRDDAGYLYEYGAKHHKREAQIRRLLFEHAMSLSVDVSPVTQVGLPFRRIE